MATGGAALSDLTGTCDDALRQLAGGDVQRALMRLTTVRRPLMGALDAATDRTERFEAALGLVISDVATAKGTATLGRHLGIVVETADTAGASRTIAALWRSAQAHQAAGQLHRAQRASDISLLLVNAAAPEIREDVLEGAVAEFTGTPLPSLPARAPTRAASPRPGDIRAASPRPAVEGL